MKKKTVNSFSKEGLQRLYLDWINNFLTVPTFAEYHNISIETAKQVINAGRLINNNINNLRG